MFWMEEAIWKILNGESILNIFEWRKYFEKYWMEEVFEEVFFKKI